MTEIKLYNTRTRSKEVFDPIDPKNVRMYVCGPTVYDRAHIGNARPVVVFDVLYRLLRHVYGESAVTYVRNFTDVDDRIIEKAVATKGADETLEAATRRITDETIGWYHDDMDALGALRPDHEPRCTEYIEPMVAMSQALIDKGFAYAAEGHVLFSVEAYEKYGGLSGRSVDDMIAGARVEVAPYKRSPMDFVIWKPSTDEQPGWESPWGRGRPGWHIECSAMAKELLGEVFDIHAGGIDLQFPHHENELAQSCCAHGTERMANWWMHNEMLRVEGEKMSKSLGNFFTVRDLLDEGVSGVVIRHGLLATHYRKTADWSSERARSFERKIRNIRHILDARLRILNVGIGQTELPPPSNDIVAPLCDDLNTHLAMRNFLSRAAKLERDFGDEADQILADGFFLGFFERLENLPNLEIAKTRTEMIHGTKIDHLLTERNKAKSARDFETADRLRDGLKDAGVIVKDTAEGAIWELAPDFDASKLEALR